MKNYKDTENSFGRLPGDALQDFIEKGRSLREFVLANIDNQEASKMNQIKKISTLLIDNDPSKSPVADLFDKTRRERAGFKIRGAGFEPTSLHLLFHTPLRKKNRRTLNPGKG